MPKPSPSPQPKKSRTPALSPRTQPAPSFANALGQASTDKRIDILRLVAQSGSISQAGRDAGVSYKAAWQAIDTLTNLAGVALVESAVGGAGGGGARLTEAGQQLLDGAAQLEQARQQVLAVLQATPGAVAHAGATAGGLAARPLRTSMRNQFPCRVAKLQRQGQTVRVHLQLGGNDVLVARITRASAELLGLQPGLEVLALCKATAVSVSPLPDADGSDETYGTKQPLAANQLSAKVSRVSRSREGDEVSVTLPAGLQLVGFAPAASSLRARQPVLVQLEASAIVVALPA